MESREVRENVIVKKGFFYYLIRLFALPFQAVFWIAKQMKLYYVRQRKLYLEAMAEQKKTKNLNKLMRIDYQDDEIV